jgi:hypothetical protein
MTSINTKAHRKVILHIHLFKNAGSTVDFILRNTFGEAMVEYDGTHAWSTLKSEEIVQFIINNPQIKALTSHQALFPKDESLLGLNILPIFFLRHPIDRVGSVYSFVKRQPLDISKQSRLTTLKEFVTWRLSDEGGIVLNNFHTLRLSNALTQLEDPRTVRSNDSHLSEAKQRLQDSTFFGIVERFDESIHQMKQYLNNYFPQLNYLYEKVNVSPDRNTSIENRISEIRLELGDLLYKKLLANNEHDLELYHYGLSLFDSRSNISKILRRVYE